VTVVLVTASSDSVTRVGIVAITVTVLSELVSSPAPPSRCLTMLELVSTAVVVAVDSKDKNVVRVTPATVMTAGCRRCQFGRYGELIPLTPVNEATLVPVLVVVELCTSQLSLEVTQSRPVDFGRQSWT
jgi:hypothetical protein